MDVGVAGASVPHAMGTVGCKLTGIGKVFPHLSPAGSPGGVKFTFTATTTSCGSNATAAGAAVTITGATLKGSGYWNAPSGSGSSCASLSTDLLGVVKVKYTWAASSPIAPTVITTSGGVPWIPASPFFHFALPSGAIVTSSSGSFSPVATESVNFTTDIPAACSSTWGPYATFHITSGYFNI